MPLRGAARAEFAWKVVVLRHAVMVTLKQLETFFWVSRLRTFQSAADRLFTTQSAVSKRLQELETALGFPVFDRQQRTLRLSKKGEDLLVLVEEVLRVVDKIEALGGNAPGTEATFRFGVTEFSSLTWMPTAVAAMQRAFPHVTVHAEVGMNRTLHAELQAGTLDLAVVHDVIPELAFVTRELSSVRYALMASPELLEGRECKSLEDLLRFTMIHQGANSWSGLNLNRWMRARGIVFPRTLASNSLTATMRLTVAGVGISCLPYDCTRGLREAGRLVALEVEPHVPPVPYFLVYRESTVSSLYADMAAIVESVCDFSRGVEMTL